MIYYGQINCQATYQAGKKKGQTCQNKAYYQCGPQLFLCGVHSKAYLTQRQLLPKDPRAKEHKQQAQSNQQQTVEQAALANRQAGRSGQVIVDKLRMRATPPTKEGLWNVFPNYKHGNRSDGLGLAGLSPMSLGPIEHGMSGLPPATNLENFWQFSKVFPQEVDLDQQPTMDYWLRRQQGYLDPQPHRHKFPRGDLAKLGNPNKPLYSVFLDKEGQAYYFDYLSSRYFYCHLYEKLAKRQPQYQQLVNYLAQGYNLQILGYDGYPVTKSPLEHYLDTSRPFGHELVLYCLLTCQETDYPWNQVYQVNQDLYQHIALD